MFNWNYPPSRGIRVGWFPLGQAWIGAWSHTEVFFLSKLVSASTGRGADVRLEAGHRLGVALIKTVGFVENVMDSFEHTQWYKANVCQLQWEELTLFTIIQGTWSGEWHRDPVGSVRRRRSACDPHQQTRRPQPAACTAASCRPRLIKTMRAESFINQTGTCWQSPDDGLDTNGCVCASCSGRFGRR